MLENLAAIDNISYILVFIEGVLSFLSPCVLPLIPIYMSYLAGSAKDVDSEGNIAYKRTAVFLHTVFFVLGISFAFFLLGMAFTGLGNFFKTNQLLFTRLGGVVIIVLGLYQLGLLDFKFLQRERKIRVNLANRKMNPLLAFIMGFTFSFAWTPCVGPALSSVLILASGAKSYWISNLLVLLYSAGFVIPFLILGLFTTQVLSFLKKRQRLLKYTVKVGGLILIIIGIMTFTGWMNGISKYLNKISGPIGISREQEENIGTDTEKIVDKADNDISEDEVPTGGIEDTNTGEDSKNTNDAEDSKDTEDADSNDKAEKTVYPAIDFTLQDQYGNLHTLSDYKGKVVFLNFWATWCPPCLKEMPDIEQIYKDYGQNEEDVIILGVANPSGEEYPNNNDESKEYIIKFLEDNGYTFPVVFDETGELLREYFINAFPTTFLIDKEGNIFGYAPAMLSKNMMDSAIQQTLASTEQ